LFVLSLRRVCSSSPDTATPALYTLSLHDALPIWMKAERVVIDTNVLIAALISPAGTSRRAFDAVLDREIDVLLSEAVFDELVSRSEEHTSELQSRENLVCRLLLEKKKKESCQCSN